MGCKWKELLQNQHTSRRLNKVVNAKFRKDEMYLCDQYRFSLLETCTKFFILWGKLLAVAAPKKKIIRRKKKNQTTRSLKDKCSDKSLQICEQSQKQARFEVIILQIMAYWHTLLYYISNKLKHSIRFSTLSLGGSFFQQMECRQ